MFARESHLNVRLSEMENKEKKLDIRVSEIENKEKKLENLIINVASEDNQICLICMENAREIAFVDCGHLICCKVCSDQLMNSNRKCPTCRKIIEQAIKIYQN
mgnify:CR=1 FL=1